jgi:mRNA interferase HigB
MTVIGLKKIIDFSRSHAEAKAQISAWLLEAEEAQWETPLNIKARFPSASFLADNRVIFNIKGKKYRLDTKLSYKSKIVFIKRIGTHAEYSKWDF